MNGSDCDSPQNLGGFHHSQKKDLTPPCGLAFWSGSNTFGFILYTIPISANPIGFLPVLDLSPAATRLLYVLFLLPGSTSPTHHAVGCHSSSALEPSLTSLATSKAPVISSPSHMFFSLTH